ncbi:TetR/AcrR family transcriptional regulator [Streptomyces sp. NPDC004284]|uniref:TetR/AcrR family transcriptional regulator n=1 Tax=Streptomyces sp. NPDC004284 TaxID=3364695 RepID=UPI00369D00F8
MSQRVYTSQLRAQRAEETRRAIVETARDLFASRGYGRVSVATVAAEAGVALNTVYSSVGGKPALILAMAQDSTDDELTGRTMRQIVAAGDGREILRLTAAGTGAVIERHFKTLMVLMDARNSDADVAKAADYALGFYRNHVNLIADRLFDLGEVRPDLTREQVRDIVWFYFGASAWTTAVRELGWAYDQAGEWLEAQAAAAVLIPR